MKLKQRLKSFFSRPLCLGRRPEKEEIEVSPNIHYIFPRLKLRLARKGNRHSFYIAVNYQVDNRNRGKTVGGYALWFLNHKHACDNHKLKACGSPYLIDYRLKISAFNS